MQCGQVLTHGWLTHTREHLFLEVCTEGLQHTMHLSQSPQACIPRCGGAAVSVYVRRCGLVRGDDAWHSPMVVVDLPSPSGVGLMPVTTCQKITEVSTGQEVVTIVKWRPFENTERRDVRHKAGLTHDIFAILLLG